MRTELKHMLWLQLAEYFARGQSWARSQIAGEFIWVDSQGIAKPYDKLNDRHIQCILRRMQKDARQDTPQYEAMRAVALGRRLRW